MKIVNAVINSGVMSCDINSDMYSSFPMTPNQAGVPGN